jgi:uncharacterized LabA/DUF88 family protein
MAAARVIAYVDGFNFYHGLMAKGWGRYRWLDFRCLIRQFVLANQELIDLKYFTALVTHPPAKLKRQRLYVRALQKHGEGLDPIYGVFATRDVQCAKCGEWYPHPQEKRTDVNIATHLIADAFDNRFDTAILVCADTDLVPAVEYVQRRFSKRFVVIDPPRRHSTELAEIADVHLHFQRRQLNQCQLPNPVEYRPRKNRVRRIHRPQGWGT